MDRGALKYTDSVRAVIEFVAPSRLCGRNKFGALEAVCNTGGSQVRWTIELLNGALKSEHGVLKGAYVPEALLQLGWWIATALHNARELDYTPCALSERDFDQRWPVWVEVLASVFDAPVPDFFRTIGTTPRTVDELYVDKMRALWPGADYIRELFHARERAYLMDALKTPDALERVNNWRARPLDETTMRALVATYAIRSDRAKMPLPLALLWSASLVHRYGRSIAAWWCNCSR